MTKKELREAKKAEESKKKLDYDPSILGHAYYLSDAWTPGTIWYSGASFQDTPIRYDLVRDELTLPPVEPDAPAHKFRLISEKVDSFAINGHTFIRIEDQKGLPDGFYEKLYAGKLQVLARRQKYIYKETTYQKVTDRFLTEDRFYLYKDREYEQVKNKSALLKELKDRKNELEQYITKEQLDFKDDFEQSLVKVAAYYDSLKR